MSLDLRGDLKQQIAQKQVVCFVGAGVARAIGLGAALRLAAGETKSGGRDNPTILGDACEALMAADGAVLSNDELVGRVWDENADPFTNSVRMTVLRLRRKLGDPPVIETVKGAGYRI